jgi:hypothetical protein
MAKKEEVVYIPGEIHNVIIGRCRACGGERVINADPSTIGAVVKKLLVLRTQKCGTYDTWTLAEGYSWDLSHLT